MTIRSALALLGAIILAGSPAVAADDFDRRSALEISYFVAALDAHEAVRTLPPTDPPAATSGLAAWTMTTRTKLLSAAALTGLVSHPAPQWTMIAAASAARISAEAARDAMADAATRAFHTAYVAELVRLATLWPRTTSEIAIWGPHETIGADLPDRTFLLTFDDGPDPSTTARIVAQLRTSGASGIFFTLGDKLAALPGPQRAQLYAGMCLASHGATHDRIDRAPDRLPAVLQSLADLDHVALTMGGTALRMFRPPFGLRTEVQSAALARERIAIVLWTIDSQDWKLQDAGAIAARLERLMHLWRRGIVLFHDIYPSTADALRATLDSTRGRVTWLPCHALPRP